MKLRDVWNTVEVIVRDVRINMSWLRESANSRTVLTGSMTNALLATRVTASKTVSVWLLPPLPVLEILLVSDIFLICFIFVFFNFEFF